MSDLKYLQVAPEDAEAAMRATGISAGMARSLGEMYRAFHCGIIRMPARTPEITTPTSLEEFCASHAAGFR
jgi:hypothetical protein